jgi:hypothetical protein
MRQGPRTIRWRAHDFHFETLQGEDTRGGQTPVWAVSWHGEFIGTMAAGGQETTKEFELRAVRWLADLLRY